MDRVIGYTSKTDCVKGPKRRLGMVLKALNALCVQCGGEGEDKGNWKDLKRSVPHLKMGFPE